MGYRNYFSKLKKADYDRAKLEKRDYDYHRSNIIELFELGKDVDREVVDSFKVIENYNDEDTELIVIEPSAILNVVEHYSKKHLKFLKGLLGEYDDTFSEWEKVDLEYRKEENQGICTAEKFVKDQIYRWSEAETRVYNDNLKRDNIVESWEYQYEIFELLRIYKSFDFKTCYLVWEGK